MDNSSPFYLLRWSDHITNYAEMFLTLREEEEFVDCSIACDDGVVGAHKIVLAGCSPYLRDLLKRSSNPHPIIFLVNVSRSTVLLLLEFIYRGQAHIPYSRLHQLVSLGKSMQIKGISKIILPENNIPIVSRGLPVIPRLHGMPDPLSEVVSDSLSERDSSNQPSPRNDDAVSGSASEDLGANSPRTSNVQTVEVEKDKANSLNPRKNVRAIVDDDDNVNSTPKSKKQKKQGEGLVKPVREHRTRIGATKDSSSETTNNNLIKNRLVDSTVSNGIKMKKGAQLKSTYVPKPRCKQAKRNSMSLSSPEKTFRNVPSKIKSPENLRRLEKESQKNEEKVVKRGRPPLKNKGVKAKPPVFKVKKLPSFGRVKREPKSRLYKTGENLQFKLGEYAAKHGIEMSKSDRKESSEKHGQRPRVVDRPKLLGRNVNLSLQKEEKAERFQICKWRGIRKKARHKCLFC